MWIEETGGVKFLSPDGNGITIAMTDPTGSVTVEQMGNDKDTWFEYKDGGETANLNSDNTAKGIFAPIRLRITAVGTGVRLYHRKLPDRKREVILT